MKSIPGIRWNYYDDEVVGKGSNDERVSRLDTNIRSGALFSRINAKLVSRQDAIFKLDCLGAWFSRINTALVSRLDARVESDCPCEIFLRMSAVLVSRVDTRVRSGFIGASFLRINSPLVSILTRF